MLRTEFTQMKEGTGYAQIELHLYIENGDKAKWNSLGGFLLAILPLEEAQQLLAEIEAEIHKRGLAK